MKLTEAIGKTYFLCHLSEGDSPETGFMFRNRLEFDDAHGRLFGYIEGDDAMMAVFEASDYDLGAGVDGQDTFRNATHLFSVSVTSNYDQILERL